MSSEKLKTRFSLPFGLYFNKIKKNINNIDINTYDFLDLTGKMDPFLDLESI